MARWSVSRHKDVIRMGRMDGEYHSHSASQIESRLVNSDIEILSLKDCCERITSGHTPLRHDLSLGEVSFLTVECVSPLHINYGAAKRVLSKHYYGELNRVALTEDSVVVTIKRRIAQASPCYGLRGQAVVNQDVAVLTLRKGWNAGYIAAFLSSRLGQQLADREKTEQMNPYLPVGKLGNLLIPRLADSGQASVDLLIKHAFCCLGRSDEATAEAHQLLDSALGLDKLKFRKPVGYTTSLSEIETSRRFDSERYSPAFGAFRAGLPDNISLSALSNDLDFCKRGKQPTYSTTGLPVINSKHVQPNRVLLDKTRRSRANLDTNLQIRFGDTLLNGTGRGTIGRTAPYLNEDMAVPDNHVTILRSRRLDPAYLSLYLNSAAGQMQVEMHQRGSSGQLELYPLDIRKFLVWVASDDFQQEIRRLHDSAAAAERESRSLLEQAKLRVEQLIEEAVQP